jgi:glycosyltransferase involved in cell wall biosynthesis
VEHLRWRRVIALIPAYNEERFIGSVVLRACEFADEVVVVDDGSTDGTGQVARAAGAILLEHEFNKGKGEALNTGFCHARSLGASIVVTLDADGQHFPRQLHRLVAPVQSGDADIVIGSRYLDARSQVPRHRVWGHKLFNFVTNRASRTSVTDSQSGFRAFSKSAIETICFNSNGFAVESEMQFIAREHDLILLEVPITIGYPGRPKRSVIGQGMSVLHGILRLTGQYRPLLFFGLPGVLMILLGLLFGIRILRGYGVSTNVVLENALIAGLLFVAGTIIFSTGIVLHSVRGLLIDLFRSHNNH